MGQGSLCVLGIVIFFASGLLMFVFWLTTLYGWLGVVGLILGVIPTPGALLFPLVYWYVEGTFPTVYFAIWGVGPAGMAAAALGGLGSETQR